jgi:16S rRNA (cytosine1402-N4)-methyltransferase
MHQPVMVREVVELLGVKPGGRYIDGTVGGGGHAEAIMKRAGEQGALLGIDRDAEAIGRAGQRLAPWGDRCRLVHGNFSELESLASAAGWSEADGVLLDLGMSSYQVDTPERGFSFQHEGPLDMRMDVRQALTAAQVVNTYEEKELADLLWRLGEERAARRIARWIVEERERAPMTSTRQLADLVERAKGRRGRAHPATQTFQALRMEVNREIEAVDRGVAAALRVVRPGGRVAVITFHSLEDRAAKQMFARHAGRWESLQAGGERWVGEPPRVRWISKKPVVATDEEVEANPRARSAKLRVVEKEQMS